MTWCNRQEVEELIVKSRCQSDIAPGDRKAADLTFINLCTTSINIGDALVQIALDDNSSASPAVRLNAALAVEPLFTLDGWREGKKFSDKVSVVAAMVDFVVQPCSSSLLHETVAGCVARVAASEFPSSTWTSSIQTWTSGVLEGSLPLMKLLSALASHSYASYELWHFLANDVTRALLNHLLVYTRAQNVGTLKNGILHFFLQLMRKRPRPSAAADLSLSATSPCLLLSDEMGAFVLSEVQHCVEDSSTGSPPTHNTDAFIVECDVLLAISQRLVKHVTAANIVFRAGSFFLVRCQPLYSQSCGLMDTQMLSLIENALECLLSVLQAFPDVSKENNVEELLSCLLCFMAYSEEELEVDSISTLMGLIMDDEAVPLGCGSGDIASLAGSVLELFLEANTNQLKQAVTTLVEFLVSMTASPASTSAMQWSAIARAFRCVARVYESNDSSPSSHLTADLVRYLLTALTNAVPVLPNACVLALMLEAFLSLFINLTDGSILNQFVDLLGHVYNGCGANSPEVRSVCIYALGRLTREARRDLMNVRREWLGLCLYLVTEGPPEGIHVLQLFCGMTTFCAVASLSPLTPSEMQEEGNRIVSAASALCWHCQTRTMAGVLQQFMKCTCLHSETHPSACGVSDALITAIIAHSHSSSTGSRPLVLRCLGEYMLSVSGERSMCFQCAHRMLSTILPTVVQYVALECPFDEGTSRIFATSISTAVAALKTQSDVLRAYSSTAHMLASCMKEGHSCQTLSTVGASLAVQLVAEPSMLDADSSALVECMFPAGPLASRKGVNFMGPCLVLSLFLLRHPGSVRHLVDASAKPGLSAQVEAWQRGLGWWFSLAQFADAFTLRSFMLCWARVIASFSAWPMECLQLLRLPLAACTVYMLPSTLAKQLPASKQLHNSSFIFGLVTALRLVTTRYARTNKSSLVAPATVDMLGGSWACASIANDDASFAALAGELMNQCDVMEGCNMLLRMLCSMGFSDVVEEVDKTLITNFK